MTSLLPRSLSRIEFSILPKGVITSGEQIFGSNFLDQRKKKLRSNFTSYQYNMRFGALSKEEAKGQILMLITPDLC
jgi:hypothetical protein